MTAFPTPPLIAATLLLASALAHGQETPPTAKRLRVGVVQMALSSSISDNRDRIVSGISEAAARDARVVVFPEGALRGAEGDDQALVDEAVADIRRAARDADVYVLFGGKTYLPHVKKDANWMRVLGPDGRELMYYEKIYDNHRAAMPGVFTIDGILCNAMICADRWLRGVEEIPIQQGAQVSFELSNNFACEWVPPFEWYWNVPRAMRNDVWVVLANSCNAAGVESLPVQSCHGHSAIIAPDGQVLAASRDNAESIDVADIDVDRATRAGALARAAHPALRPFWEAGMKLQRGESVDAPPLTQLNCPETEITIAAAQVVDDLPRMIEMIGEAASGGADLVVFPARAIEDSALESLQAAAREQNVTVVVGMEHRLDDGIRNSAFVIDPDGRLLTRYDQLSAESPFQAGLDPRAMWFVVKGVPAIVTIEGDAQWTELAELAAVVGARIHVHLDHDPAGGPAADLRRLQVWANLMSFQTFGATVNVTGSALWDDLRDRDERRTALFQEGYYGDHRPADVPDPHPESISAEVLSPFSANLVAHSNAGSRLLLAMRHVSGTNPQYPSFTSRYNPQMDAWYRIGAAIVAPE